MALNVASAANPPSPRSLLCLSTAVWPPVCRLIMIRLVFSSHRSSKPPPPSYRRRRGATRLDVSRRAKPPVGRPHTARSSRGPLDTCTFPLTASFGSSRCNPRDTATSFASDSIDLGVTAMQQAHGGTASPQRLIQPPPKSGICRELVLRNTISSLGNSRSSLSEWPAEILFSSFLMCPAAGLAPVGKAMTTFRGLPPPQVRRHLRHRGRGAINYDVRHCRPPSIFANIDFNSRSVEDFATTLLVRLISREYPSSSVHQPSDVNLWCIHIVIVHFSCPYRPRLV